MTSLPTVTSRWGGRDNGATVAIVVARTKVDAVVGVGLRPGSLPSSHESVSRRSAASKQHPRGDADNSRRFGILQIIHPWIGSSRYRSSQLLALRTQPELLGVGG